MMPRAGKLSDRLRVLRLADSLVRKPLVWSHSGPIASDRRVLCFLMFRSFVRALSQYRSLVLLLKSGAWEDALVLARSLYELNVNLSEIASAADPEDKAQTFFAFGKFQQVRLFQMRLEDELRDKRSDAHTSAETIATGIEHVLNHLSASVRDCSSRGRVPPKRSRAPPRCHWNGANSHKCFLRVRDTCRSDSADRGRT